MESPEKNSIIDGAVNYSNSFILSTTTDKKIILIKKIEAVNHCCVFSKKIEAMPKEITTRINN